MIDFTRLAHAGGSHKPASLLDTFKALDRQVSHVELRPSQLKTLDALSTRIDEHDLVVKLNTGGGKTTIGLLYLKHLMEKNREPSVYLVPTTQLVEQVIAEGRNIGIRVFHWKAGESHAPEEALRCEGVIVCTYDKFFNGKSTFARQHIVPSAIVLDDVHLGIETIRQQFSAVLEGALRDSIITLLDEEMTKHDAVNWAGIRQGVENVVVEVPYWIQQRNQVEITKILANAAETDPLKFVWPNIAQSIDSSRIFISGHTSFITVDPPPIERTPHYVGASHRLFMSASVHDGSVLVRELGCDKEAAQRPVDASGETSIGERLVLVPSLVDPEFSDGELIAVARTISAVANVVVLVPSFAHARKWEEAGASVAHNDSISKWIETLKKSTSGNIVVFAQRYDGIDLPDHACRLLIIDGLPVGDNLADRHEAAKTSAAGGMRGKTAIKIEQGLGRAVRSASDYCVVILGGRDVAGFVSRSQVVKNLSPFTVRQLEIGREVSAALRGTQDVGNGLVDTVMQVLKRDTGWKNYYLQSINKVEISPELKHAIEGKIEAAMFEREASKRLLSRDYITAAQLAQRAADSIDEKDLRGSIKQTSAQYQFFYDEPGAMQLQVSAYNDNPHVLRPPMLLPAQFRRVTTQAEEIASWLKSFTDPNGPLLAVDSLKSRVAFSNEAKCVEEAMRDLGELLGADSTRPDRDFNRGPDNLWIFGNEAFVIEVKSEKTSHLSKSDAEQLQSSVQWVENNFPGVENINAIIVSDICSADVVDDFIFGATVWSGEDLGALIERLRKLSSSAITQGELFLSSPVNIQRSLGPHQLLPAQIKSLGGQVQQKRLR